MLSNRFQCLFRIPAEHRQIKKLAPLVFFFSFGIYKRGQGGEEEGERGEVSHGIFQIMRAQRKASAVRMAREDHFEAGVLAKLMARR